MRAACPVEPRVARLARPAAARTVQDAVSDGALDRAHLECALHLVLVHQSLDRARGAGFNRPGWHDGVLTLIDPEKDAARTALVLWRAQVRRRSVPAAATAERAEWHPCERARRHVARVMCRKGSEARRTCAGVDGALASVNPLRRQRSVADDVAAARAHLASQRRAHTSRACSTPSQLLENQKAW
eukprot:2836629-Prymnesium_polylepis.3